MTIFQQDAFDAYVTTLAGAWVLDQWDSRVAKVGNKVFALLGGNSAETRSIVVKIDTEEFDFFSTLPGVTQAPYFAKRHWVAVSDDSALSDEEVRERIADSWVLVAASLTRKTRAELGITLPPRS